MFLVEKRSIKYAARRFKLMNKVNRRKNSSSLIVKVSPDRFKMVFKNSPVALFLVDGSAALNHLKILEVNKAAIDLFEAANGQELISNFIPSISKSSVKVLAQALAALKQGTNFFESDIQINTLKRNRCDCLMRIAVPKDHQMSLERFIISLLDITARKRMERHLRKMAQLDGLTKLFNHYAIVERLEEELNRSKRYGVNVSCLMIDVDRFKLINDKFGHPKGDQILKRVALLIKKNLRNTDIVGRYGGDEFFVILPETKPKNARLPALRIQQAFKLKMRQYHLSLANTLSIGISGYPAQKIRHAKDLIERADQAMYQARSKGRDRIVVL